MFIGRFLAKQAGKASELSLCEPDCRREIGSVRFALHVEVLLYRIQNLWIHGFGHGAPSGASLKAARSLKIGTGHSGWELGLNQHTST
jgi:hypothetical protein